MKAYIPKNFYFVHFILLITLFQSGNLENITSKGKCIFMKSDSSAYNFHYLKSGKDENK